MDLKRYKVPHWYKPPSLFYRICWVMTSLVFFETGIPFGSFFFRFVLRVFGGNIGKGVVIKPGVKIKNPKNLSVGRYSWIGERVWIDNLDNVLIGENCCISQGAYLLTGNHNFKKRNFDLLISPIHIEDQVWLGAFAKVAPGTVIKKNVVVGMGIFVKGVIEGEEYGKIVISPNYSEMYTRKKIHCN